MHTHQHNISTTRAHFCPLGAIAHPCPRQSFHHHSPFMPSRHYSAHPCQRQCPPRLVSTSRGQRNTPVPIDAQLRMTIFSSLEPIYYTHHAPAPIHVHDNISAISFPLPYPQSTSIHVHDSTIVFPPLAPIHTQDVQIQTLWPNGTRPCLQASNHPSSHPCLCWKATWLASATCSMPLQCASV